MHGRVQQEYQRIKGRQYIHVQRVKNNTYVPTINKTTQKYPGEKDGLKHMF